MRNLGIADLDFATTHVYPSNWGIPASQYQWVNDNWIGDRAALAAANGKPLLMEVQMQNIFLIKGHMEVSLRISEKEHLYF